MKTTNFKAINLKVGDTIMNKKTSEYFTIHKIIDGYYYPEQDPMRDKYGNGRTPYIRMGNEDEWELLLPKFAVGYEVLLNGTRYTITANDKGLYHYRGKGCMGDNVSRYEFLEKNAYCLSPNIVMKLTNVRLSGPLHMCKKEKKVCKQPWS